jgi:hypothetical protein
VVAWRWGEVDGRREDGMGGRREMEMTYRYAFLISSWVASGLMLSAV